MGDFGLGRSEDVELFLGACEIGELAFPGGERGIFQGSLAARPKCVPQRHGGYKSRIPQRHPGSKNRILQDGGARQIEKPRRQKLETRKWKEARVRRRECRAEGRRYGSKRKRGTMYRAPTKAGYEKGG